MAQAVQRSVIISESVAGGTFCVSALENAHFVCKAAVEIKKAADSRSPVGAVRLKASCFKCFFKSFAVFDEIINRIGLVAVCNNCFAAERTNSGVNNQTRILNFGSVKGFRKNSAVFDRENSVAAVFASAHNKISKNRFFAVGSFADDYSPAGICVFAEKSGKIADVVDSHNYISLFSIIFFEQILAAAGRIFHSACSITLRCRVSGVSFLRT